MGRIVRCLMLSLLFVVVTSLFTLSQTADPFFGTWKANPAKSKFDPGPAPRSSTWTFEDRGGGVILRTSEGIDAQGNRTFEQDAFKRDGKDYPHFVLGAKVPQSLSVRLVNAYTEEVILKADGKATAISYTATISKDGKTMTFTSKGTNAQGQRINNVVVFERQ